MAHATPRQGNGRSSKGCTVSLILLAAVCLLCASWASPGPGVAQAADPSFSALPESALDVPFRWSVPDYALRCGNGPVRIRVRGGRAWRASIGNRPLRRGSFSARIPINPGRRTTVTFRRGPKAKRFHLRCLPPDFPAYEFKRSRPGGPTFIFMNIYRHFATIFDRNGVPVWWFNAGGVPNNFELLRDGTVAFNPVDDRSYQVGSYEIRSLGGRFIRRVGTHQGGTADVHELLLLQNGNYLLGRQVRREGVDTSAFGGSPESSVTDIELQEVTRRGRIVWRWNSADHISLAETGRWWDEPILGYEPYDIVHWNSVAVKGKYMLLSFRHLDAVYKVNRVTGRIVWKLGGTETAESLDVVGDPYGSYPLGAQHDARFLADGTISIYDNRSALPHPPRVVRYRVDEKARTARRVQSFRDRQIPISVCCGSARRIGKTWLVGWGGTPTVSGYDLRGRRRFSLTTEIGFTYRANYATSRQLTKTRVRRAMDAVVRRGRAAG